MNYKKFAKSDIAELLSQDVNIIMYIVPDDPAINQQHRAEQDTACLHELKERKLDCIS
jgi:hypothetical protein